MCGWMNDVCFYILLVGIGEVMCVFGVGKVLVLKYFGFQVGDYVNGVFGVQDYFIGEFKGFYKVDLFCVLLLCYFLVLGMIGMIVYFVLFDVGQLKNGEIVVIFGVVGVVGSVVGQIVRFKGCWVVGIVGGVEKCCFLVEELGFDGVIDYKNEDFVVGFKCECLKGIDVFFDNVGGEIFDIVFICIVFKVCIVFCGVISQYNNKEVVCGLVNYLLLLVNWVCMEGMVVMDYVQCFLEGLKEMVIWLVEGKL